MKRLIPILSLLVCLPIFLFSKNTNTTLVSSAGTMNLTPESICFGESAFPNHNNDETLDPGDILKFVIHDNSGAMLGNMFGGQGDMITAFGVSPGMSFGTTYYLSAIAGADDGTGKVDLNDPDLSVAQGTPVTFLELVPIFVVATGTLDCNNASVTLIANSNSPNNTYLWANGATGQTIQVSAAGTYMVTVTNVNGCTNVDDVTVIEDTDIPNACVFNTGTLTCALSSVLLDGTCSSVGPNFDYFWSINGVVLGTGPIINATFPGVYELIVTNNANGCTASSIVIVDQDSNIPIADAGPDQILDCNINQVELDGSGSSTGSAIAYTWTTFNGNIVSGESTLNPVVNAVGTYELIVTNVSNGCTTTASVEVVGTGALGVSLGTNTYLDCSGTMVIEAINPPIGPDFTYEWTTTDGVIVSGGNTTSATVSSVGTYTLTINDLMNMCSGFDVITIFDMSSIVVVNPNMNLSCNTNLPNVLDATIINPNFNLSYQWTTTDGNFLSGTNILNPIVGSIGTYELVVTDNDNGCTTSATIVMNDFVFPIPVIDVIGGNTELTCNNPIITLDASGSTAASGVIAYQWSLDGVPAISNSATLDATIAGVYEVLIIDIVNDCVDIAQVELTANATVPTFTIPSEITLDCNNAFTQDITPVLDVPSTNASYAWIGDNGFTSNDATITLSGTVSGTYELTVTDLDNGCSTIAVMIVNNDGLDFDIATTEAMCDQQDGTATVNTSISNPSFAWSTGATGNTIMGLAQGWYSVTVTDNDNNCSQHENFFIDEDISCKVVIGGYIVNDPDTTCNYNVTMEGIECVMVKLEPLGIFTLTDATGYYEFIVDDGSYTVEYIGSAEVDLLCPMPGTYDVTLSTNGTMSAENHFYVLRPEFDLCITKFSGNARPGLDQFNCVQICNYGENLQDATVTFTHDSIFSNQSPWPVVIPYLGNIYAPTFVYDAANNTFTWELTDMEPGECRKIMFFMPVPVTAMVGDILHTEAKVNPIAGDANPANNCLAWDLPITGSFDPNDKRNFVGEDPWGGAIYEDDITMEYAIRFQNVGNDTAFTVVVRDTLDDEHLDVTTIRGFTASHDMQVQFEDSNVLIFTFENILLVDSMTNEPGSNGWLVFDIDRKPDLPFGTEIDNQAAIYFDFNEPVITNEVLNVLTEPVSVFSPTENKIQAKVTPTVTDANVLLEFTLENSSSTSISIYNVGGVLLQETNLGKIPSGIQQETLNLKDFSAGVYFIFIKTEEGSAVKKVVRR